MSNTPMPVTGFAMDVSMSGDGQTMVPLLTLEAGHAVTTLPREAGPRVNPFRLPRVAVADSGEVEFRRMVLCHG